MIVHQLRCTHAKDSAGVDLAIIEALGPVADAGGNGILRTDVVDIDRIQSLSLEGLVVTLDEDVPAGVSEAGRRRIEWRFPATRAAADAYGHLVRCGLAHRFWVTSIPGGCIRTRHRPTTAVIGSSADVEIEPEPTPMPTTFTDNARTAAEFDTIDSVLLHINSLYFVGLHTGTGRAASVRLDELTEIRLSGARILFLVGARVEASLTFPTPLGFQLNEASHVPDAARIFGKIRDRLIGPRGGWRVAEDSSNHLHVVPDPKPADTGMPRLESIDKPWFQQVAAWEEQLGHVPPDQLCTIKAGDLSVLIAEAHMLHATLVLSCNDEPVEQARVWLGQIAAQPASARCEMRVDDMRQLLVDAMQERERVKADRIVVDRVHHNDLLRLRNVLADFVSTVGGSTIGRMIAAALQAEHDEEMFRIEEVL